MITIIVEGPDRAGKSHAIALIAKQLKNSGCEVTIQSEDTHNAGTMAMTEAKLIDRLCTEHIVIKELRTSALAILNKSNSRRGRNFVQTGLISSN